MQEEKERLAIAQWVLERSLGWIAAAEVKVGVIVAIDTAMGGAMAAAYGTNMPHSTWAKLWATIASVLILLSMLYAAFTVLPKLDGPKASLLFFGRVADMSGPDYQRRFKTAPIADLLDDWTAQIHRNAEIAREKHAGVRTSMLFSFGATIPWACAVATLLKV